GTRVNMRNGPGTSFPILATLTRGAEAEVIAEPGNGWLQIRVSDTGAVGWMAESLMQPVN
ncbi:MAG: SH3 domain-containing protein, partial [Pseudomonadota bacterium]